VQFALRHTQTIECGGGAVKLFAKDADAATLSGDTPFSLAFGPDICGTSTREIKLAFTNNGKEFAKSEPIRAYVDHLTHIYTLVVDPVAKTYRVLVDGRDEAKGSLLEDWNWFPPKMMKDPAASVPADWVYASHIEDDEDEQPDDYDEAANGAYVKKTIVNPAYKGEWVHPLVANPNYSAKLAADESLTKNVGVFDVARVGFELWQVKSGSVFDNILVTDSLADALAFAEKTFPEESRKLERIAWERAEATAQEMRAAAMQQREKEVAAINARAKEMAAAIDATDATDDAADAAAKATKAKPAAKAAPTKKTMTSTTAKGASKTTTKTTKPAAKKTTKTATKTTKPAAKKTTATKGKPAARGRAKQEL
jgi:calreticulin